jgi:alanyl-tRNA synthetase
MYMTAAELREKYLSFFEAKGCKRMPSSSLVPDDPSLLLTSAGMVQFKPYFLHQKQLPEPFIGTTTVQKCVRTTDIDIIGTTGRHQSFFEMLGNFSFGKYFKKEMCAWAYEFSTEVLGFDPERLYFTVYLDDDETEQIWRSLGVPESHISRLGADDNFWAAGPTGPCGPCSELYYDQGPEFGCGKPDCAPGCDCDRYLEFWNLVFTQYDRQEDGTLEPLLTKNIDTGMGLERTAAILQGVQSNYETDILQNFIKVGERLSGKRYGEDAHDDLSLRIIADHSRAVTFMIADGILPANEGRGYVLRRLLRRAVRHGHVLGIEGPFLDSYIDAIVAEMGDVYPEIVENRSLIERVVLSEEERFGATIRQGQRFLDEALEKLPKGGTLSGHEAFTLHDTYGFPIELTSEICSEQGIEVDLEGFEREMDAQKERARAAAPDDAWKTGVGIFAQIKDAFGPTEFCGYSEDETTGSVMAIVSEGRNVESAEAGQTVQVVLDRTPFYAEMGGQVGDTGRIEGADGLLLEVTDTQAPEKGLHVHECVVQRGSIEVGQEVTARIDVRRRERIRRNHTATHILHWALREVLGDHVKQAGSFVAPDRLRFDFTHFEAMTSQQISQVEGIANQCIMDNAEVHVYETSLASAREAGVIALFGEKYGEFVRVVECGSYSKELCGGTHVGRTSEIGFLKIVSESSVGANLRRIEAVTSYDALDRVNARLGELDETAHLLGVPIGDVVERTTHDIAHIKELEGEVKRVKRQAAADNASEQVAQAIDVGYPLVISDVGQAEAASLREVWDTISQHMPKPGAAVLAARSGKGTPLLLAAGSKEAVDAGFDAGAVIKAIAPAVKGGGGGKPTMAQAGGKDASGIDEALRLAREMFVS